MAAVFPPGRAERSVSGKDAVTATVDFGNSQAEDQRLSQCALVTYSCG